MPSTPPLFPNGKRVAVALSFDDGRVYDRRLVELFDRLGLRATWNLNSGALRAACAGMRSPRSLQITR